MTERKKECEYCGEKKVVKSYIVADNLEEPRWLCKECYENLTYAMWLKIRKLQKKYDVVKKK